MYRPARDPPAPAALDPVVPVEEVREGLRWYPRPSIGHLDQRFPDRAPDAHLDRPSEYWSAFETRFRSTAVELVRSA